MTNAVIVWNTVSVGAVIDRLRSKGEQIAPEGLAHLSPARYDHVDPYGRYQFQVDRWAGKKPLRPINLRAIKAIGALVFVRLLSQGRLL